MPGSPQPETVVTCSLPATMCDEALRAVESTAALQVTPAALPPKAVQIVPADACGTITGAPPGYNLCAAPAGLPRDPAATATEAGLASVTYRAGGGRSFMFVWWQDYGSRRGPISAFTITHSP